MKTVRLMKTQIISHIRQLLLDGTLEYQSSEFQDFYVAQGILHPQSLPYTTQKKGWSKTPQSDAAGQPLLASWIPHPLPVPHWSESLSYIFCARNCSPHPWDKTRTLWEFIFSRDSAHSLLLPLGSSAIYRILP
eukprot:TRINITY_DN5758_c0_g1_i1.p1 TRINITY_DN5758_c0_g1~~TRINITY_DN5758_c0_g1_i1.p1  ORF type:complete len:134 (-),score=0.11 TRINITY_DN5758_c0_g1_i1:92-493(-)